MWKIGEKYRLLIEKDSGSESKYDE